MSWQLFFVRVSGPCIIFPVDEKYFLNYSPVFCKTEAGMYWETAQNSTATCITGTENHLKYAARKEAFREFLWGQVRLDDDSRFSFLWLESLAKWGKMGNVIWEKFKFSISLPIEAIVRCSWRGSNYLFNIWLIFHFYEFQSREFPEETNFAYYTKHWLFLRLFSAVISRTGNLPFHCFQFCAPTDSTELTLLLLPAWKVKLFLSRDFVTSFFCQMSLLSKQILLKARQTGKTELKLTSWYNSLSHSTTSDWNCSKT